MRGYPVAWGMSERPRGRRQHASADAAPELFVSAAGDDE
jgi:hypothetical protein